MKRNGVQAPIGPEDGVVGESVDGIEIAVRCPVCEACIEREVQHR